MYSVLNFTPMAEATPVPTKSDQSTAVAREVDQDDGPSELFEPLKFVNKLRKFWKTRTAVLGKTPLYDYSKSKLEHCGYMGPWEFNITQSALAGLPGTVYSAINFVLFAPKSSISAADKVQEVLHPMMLPFVLMLTAYTVGRASLRNEDFSKAARNRASRIFLFLDGAYGFYPQLLLSCLVPLLAKRSDSDAFDSTFGQISMYMFMGIGLWQLLIYLLFLQEDLFNALGYRTYGLTDSRPSPPTSRYRLSVLVAIPLIAYVVATVFALITWSGATLIALIRHRVAA
jgi:hypothetical protein